MDNMSFPQSNPQMFSGEQPADGGAPGAPGVGAPGLVDGQGQFQPGSIPAPAGGAGGSPTNPEGKTTLW